MNTRRNSIIARSLAGDMTLGVFDKPRHRKSAAEREAAKQEKVAERARRAGRAKAAADAKRERKRARNLVGGAA
jgi:hypothetical protein